VTSFRSFAKLPEEGGELNATAGCEECARLARHWQRAHEAHSEAAGNHPTTPDELARYYKAYSRTNAAREALRVQYVEHKKSRHAEDVKSPML
jgi:hypothetical protein